MRKLLVLMVILAVAPAAFGYGVEGNAGLRAAEKISPTAIRLTFGPSIMKKFAAERPGVYQVVSAEDKDFQLGVPAASVKVLASKPDGQYPDGYAGPRFDTTPVEIELPKDKPLKDGVRYWVRVNSRPVTADKRAQWVVAPGKADAEQADGRYGLRELYILSPKALHVITGPGLDLKALAGKTMVVTSKDDTDFAQGLSPEQVGRRSNLDFYIPDGWPWQTCQRHELFLTFAKPFKSGKTYELNFNPSGKPPIVAGQSTMTLKFDDRSSINLAIKVNQVGYLPDAAKYAYVGLWCGDMNAYDFVPYVEKFEVRDARTHAVVLSGKPAPVHKATYKLIDGKLDPDPDKVKGPEGQYKQDYSYEDVLSLDVSALKKEGTYYLCVPGMGRSFSFTVGADVYAGPFKTLMNGLYHQRCGIELAEPYTPNYRLACHRNCTEWSTFRAGVDKDPFANLIKMATDGKKHDIPGGHHDAGDWNPRSHLEVAEVLMLLYELNPTAFADKQLKIPEAGNGIPDILDEALWALSPWVALQDDGGVRNGIESAGDPEEGDEAATDRLREFAMAKDAAGTYRFAAAATQMSMILKKLGKDKDADVWMARATRAWQWSAANGGDKEHDYHCMAAAMLLRATGKDEYDKAFAEHSIFSKDPTTDVRKYEKYDQTYGSFYYCLADKAQPALKKAITASFENSFRYWRNPASTTAYRHMREPFAPSTWGTGGLPIWEMLPAMAMHLTRDAELKASCRQWILLTNDFSLGCNPMNLVHTVGLGQRSVTTAWHILMENSPIGIIPGLQSEGPGGPFIAGQNPGKGGMGAWPGMSLWPAGPWPDLYKFSENASPGMNEGLTVNMVQTAFSYGLFVK